MSAVHTRFRRNGGAGLLALACKERWQSSKFVVAESLLGYKESDVYSRQKRENKG